MKPEIVEICLKDREAANLVVLTYNNPYYLRGDFDGDGNSDYALEVRSKENEKNGMLICAGNGSIHRLGAGIGGRQFSDMDDDNFLAPHWVVITQKEVLELGRWTHNVPDPVPLKKGREAIEMIWEDGISLIYWDDTKFVWAGSKE